MQHSPSSAANPKVLRVNRDLVFGERFREDVRGHIFRGAIFDVNNPVRDGLANEVEADVDVLGTSVVVIICGEVERGLVVAVEGDRCSDVAEEWGDESSKPNAFLGCVRYGLKQAGRKWYDTLSRALTDLGFQVNDADPGVFSAHNDPHTTILAIHVDDCLITGSSSELIADYKHKLNQRYSLTDLGPVHWLLGIKIFRNREAHTVSLSQTSYIDTILSRFSLSNTRPLASPISPGATLSKINTPSDATEMDHMKKIPYREAVGSLMYAAVATRPDVTFAISTLSQFLENPGLVHWEAVKHVLRYLSGTKTHALTYGNERHDLLGYTDADGASQDHRHAISGYTFLIDGAAISWASRKQELVTLSTAEAEYVATTHAAKECIWLRRLTSQLFGHVTTPTTLYCDNQAALHLATDDNYHARTKHIDIRFHFIRQTITDGAIHIEYCPTQDMTADILTKALPKHKVAIHSQNLGICHT